MCGIAGLWSATSDSADLLGQIGRNMADRIVHRGPDDAGVWVDADCPLVLAHRRLAVVDLSAAGHQPMVSSSGRYVIAYNGEIYNHQDIRRTLERGAPISWSGQCDTETLLAAIEHWGPTAAPRELVGMFAFACWDRRDRRLTLVRDRLGEKPLYYGWIGARLAFGSEPAALHAVPEFSNRINRGALALYLRHNYVPAPWSIYEGIAKVPAGAAVTFSVTQRSATAPERGSSGQLQRYWSLRDVAMSGPRQPFAGSEPEARQHLDNLIRRSVQGQLLADVPVGAFLSGGIDSSLIVAVMQSMRRTPVQTFTMGFDQPDMNEAPHARAIARHLGTEHTETLVSESDVRNVIPDLPQIYSEPFSDSSQIPQALLARITRRAVTVALSGDAGDELFGGYDRYFWTLDILRRLNAVPATVRRPVAALLRALPEALWDACLIPVERLLPARFQRNPGDKAHALAGMLRNPDLEAVYRQVLSHWREPARVVGAGEHATTLTDTTAWLADASIEHRMMYLDTCMYLPDDILVKVDRAAMAASLETRVPLLDHRIVEFAWQLPAAMKFTQPHGPGKQLLRNLAFEYLPRDLLERPKMGFGVPLDRWLRGPLRDWAETLLAEETLREQGFFAPASVRLMWRQHLAGRHNWQYHLWDVLMFQAWLEQHGSSAP